MSFEPFDKLLEKDLTPEEYISELFERTDEDGILYLPASHSYMGTASMPEHDYCCRMNWNLTKCEAISKEFNRVFAAVKKIGAYPDSGRWTAQEAKKSLENGALFEVWNTYIRPFDTPGFDLEKIKDIDERLEVIATAQEVAERFSDGKELSKYEKEFLQEGLNTELSEDEEKYWDNFHALREEQSAKRIGNNVYAYETVLFAKRVCRLVNLDAPEVIINSESRRFAEAIVLHAYATEVKQASSAIREQREKLEQMSEEELDEMDRERPQTNSAKSLLPLFVHQILGKHSSGKRHLHQQEIIEYLKQPPYEIKVERKAVSRTLYTLNSWFPDSVLCDKNGWWKE